MEKHLWRHGVHEWAEAYVEYGELRKWICKQYPQGKWHIKKGKLACEVQVSGAKSYIECLAPDDVVLHFTAEGHDNKMFFNVVRLPSTTQPSDTADTDEGDITIQPVSRDDEITPSINDPRWQEIPLGLQRYGEDSPLVHSGDLKQFKSAAPSGGLQRRTSRYGTFSKWSPYEQKGDLPIDELLSYTASIQERNFNLAKLLHQNAEKVERFYRRQSRVLARNALQAMNFAKMVKQTARPDPQDLSTLKTSLQKLYYAYGLLENFATQNSDALQHLLLKVDRRSNQHLAPLYTEYVQSKYRFCYEKSNSPIQRMLDAIERIYIEVLYKGNKSDAIETLRLPSHDEEHTKGMVYSVTMGFLVGLLVLTLFMIFQEYYGIFKEGVHQHHYKEVLDAPNAVTIFSVSCLLILSAFFFSVNVIGWTYYTINYVYIFELDPREHWVGPQLGTITLRYMCTWAISLWLYLQGKRASSWIDPDAVPYWMLAVIGAMLIMDNLSIRGGGKWFLKALFRTFAAPFPKVLFSDFFLADQLTSLTGCFFEFSFIFCIFNAQSNDTCSAMRLKGVPYLAAGPHIWRLLQCFRRWWDSPDGAFHPNLDNAMKYFAGLLQIYSSLAYREAVLSGNPQHEHGAFVTWMACMIIEYLFKTSWDTYMDAGILLDGSTRVPYVRNSILYPKKSYYIWAVVNATLRLNPIVRTILVRFAGIDGWFAFFGWSSVEVFRRFLWNFFRLENEQVSNMEQYRAVTLVPPPRVVRNVDVSDVLQQGKDEKSEHDSGNEEEGEENAIPQDTAEGKEELTPAAVFPPKQKGKSTTEAHFNHPHSTVPTGTLASTRGENESLVMQETLSIDMTASLSMKFDPSQPQEKVPVGIDAPQVKDENYFDPSVLFRLLALEDKQLVIKYMFVDMHKGGVSSDSRVEQVWRMSAKSCILSFRRCHDEDRVRYLLFLLGNLTVQQYLKEHGVEL